MHKWRSSSAVEWSSFLKSALGVGVRLVLLATVVVACQGGPVGAAKPDQGAPVCRLDGEFARMARAVVDGLPARTKVVVLNFTSFRSQDVSQLGVYLAKRFGTILASQGRGRITVNDHTWEVGPHDATPCTLHDSHGIYNHTDKDLEIFVLAVAMEKGVANAKNWGDDLSGR